MSSLGISGICFMRENLWVSYLGCRVFIRGREMLHEIFEPTDVRHDAESVPRVDLGDSFVSLVIHNELVGQGVGEDVAIAMLMSAVSQQVVGPDAVVASGSSVDDVNHYAVRAFQLSGNRGSMMAPIW